MNVATTTKKTEIAPIDGRRLVCPALNPIPNFPTHPKQNQLMKKTVFIALVGLLVRTTSMQAQSVTLKPVWETDTTLRTPESVVCSIRARRCCTSPASTETPTPDNKGSYITKLGLDGKVMKLKFTDNLNSTKGMGILGNKLYVTEMTQVAEIDLATGKILNRYPVDGSKFLNDIAIDTKKGVVYVSDSGDSKIWAITNGKANLVLG